MKQARRRLPCAHQRGELLDRSEDIATIGGEPPRGLERLLQNGTYLVQDCARPGGWRVLMICRHDARDGISWDDLQWIKDHAGYRDREAVEVYPRAGDLVNVANMRHLWLLPEGSWMPHGLDKNPARQTERALTLEQVGGSMNKMNDDEQAEQEIRDAFQDGFRAGRDAAVARVLAVVELRQRKLGGRRAGLVTTAIANLAHILREVEYSAPAEDA